jgi:hypothetical protein
VAQLVRPRSVFTRKIERRSFTPLEDPLKTGIPASYADILRTFLELFQPDPFISMSQTAHPDLDPWHGLLYAVTERLTPLFKGAERGATYARYAAGEAIAAFNPQSRADYASIGRILALSLSAITAAAQSADPDLPEEQQIRFLTKAQSLSRTADQAERVMMTRRRHAPQDGTADTLIPRPPERPARYRPLPPEDPASGASLAARQAEDARQTARLAQTEQTNLTKPAREMAQNNQTTPAPPTPPSAVAVQRNQTHASPPFADKSRPDHQANPAPQPPKFAQIDQTNSSAAGADAVSRTNLESRGRDAAGDHAAEQRTLEAFIRTALAPAAGPRHAQRQFGVPDQSAPLPAPGRKDGSAR